MRTMIAAVCACKNEADVIWANIKHLLANGVDLVRVSDGMSTDGTRDILEALRAQNPGQVEIVEDFSPIFYQFEVMNSLVENVGQRGFEWVIPFDADEFIYGVNGGSIAEALNRQHNGVRSLLVHPWLHLDWDRKVIDNPYGRLPKTIFRWTPGLVLERGNHGLQGMLPGLSDVVDLREYQFRSYDHFKTKVNQWLTAMDPTLPSYEGAHYKTLAGLSEQEMEMKWQEYQSQPTVHDPVPSSFLPSIAMI